MGLTAETDLNMLPRYLGANAGSIRIQCLGQSKSIAKAAIELEELQYTVSQ